MPNNPNSSISIDESLVQWILLKNPVYFSKILNLTLGRCLGTEVTTKYGRLDFIYEYKENELLLIELETYIDSLSKLEHCTSQIVRYLKLKHQYAKKNVSIALVYADEGTGERYQRELIDFAKKHQIILKHYSIYKLLMVYDKMLNQLHRTSGISLGRAVALGITSLTWLKKFIFAFLNGNCNSNGNGNGNGNGSGGKSNDSVNPVDHVTWNDLKGQYSSTTNFYVLKRFAEDFELVQVKNFKRNRIFELTPFGQRFRDDVAMELQFQANDSEISNQKKLTINQKRLLIEILLNGNFTKIKVNMFHFLRFIHLTEGTWLPKQSSKLTKAEQQYLNNMFRTSYNTRTLKDIVQQTCTFCEELGFVEKLPMPNQVYDKVIFTSLGSRVYNYFEQLLNVERERYQIPMQIRS